MRDMERIKPKYNVTLDNKQIVMLIISSIVILVLVFIIGFVLGKNTGIKESQLASASSQGNMPQNAVVFTQQTMQSGQGVTQPSEGGGQVTGETQGPAGAVTRTTAGTSHTELTFYKSLTNSGKQKKTEKKPVKKAEKKIIEKKKTVRAERGKFSIQCGAFREKSQAERLGSELKKKYGMSSWIEPIAGQGEKLFRVKIGHFETREQAQAYQKQRLLPKGLRNCVITVDK